LFFALYCVAVRPSLRILAASADAPGSRSATLSFSRRVPAAALGAADGAGGRDVHVAFRFVRRHHRRTVVAVASPLRAAFAPAVAASFASAPCAPAGRPADVPEYPPAVLS
jgi:hypothetical protein